MAKRKNVEMGLGNLDYSHIHWFHVDNGRKTSYGDPLSDLHFKVTLPENEGEEAKVTGQTSDGLVYKLYNDWNTSQGIVKVGTLEHLAELRGVSVESLTEIAFKERQDMIDRWRSEPSGNYKGLANVAERLWFPNGKPADILVFGNECFRRSIGVMGAIYRRHLPPMGDDSLRFNIPVNVVEWASEKARIQDHLRENTGKDEGRQKLNTLDFLNHAVMLYSTDPFHAKEADLVDAGVKRGTAQKLFRYTKLAHKHRPVKLIERAFMKMPESGITEYSPDCPIPIESIDKEEVQRLLQGKEWRNKSDKPLKVTDKVIHQWLAETVTGKTTTPPTMTAKEIRELRNSPVIFVRKIADAIIEKDEGFFRLLAENYASLNEGYESVFGKDDEVPEADVDADVEADVEAEAEA